MEFVMYRYVFLFRFEDIENFKKDIFKHLNQLYVDNEKESYILSQEVEIRKSKNTIYLNKLNTVEIRLYKKDYIFGVFTNKVKDLKQYKFLMNYYPINLVNNTFVNKVFKSGFSNNLTKISIEVDKKYGQESFELIGNKLFDIDIFNDVDVFNYNSIWNIKEYTFQPSLSKYCIKIKEPNRIEFNKNILSDVGEKIIRSIISILLRDGDCGK